jgi:hypothetical protein
MQADNFELLTFSSQFGKLGIAPCHPIGYNVGRSDDSAVLRQEDGRQAKGQRPLGHWPSTVMRTGLARLADRTQALGAELHLNRDAAIERERRLLNVWLPHAAGKIVSVADVVAERGLFAAELTLCHDKTDLLGDRRALRNTLVTLILDYTISAAGWQTRSVPASGSIS